MTPGIGMCATKRKITSIAKTNASLARTSGWLQASITAWRRRGRCDCWVRAAIAILSSFFGSFRLLAPVSSSRAASPGGRRAATRRLGFSASSARRGVSSITVPPAASIFCRAVAEKRSASTVSATLISPSPRIFTGMRADFTRPAARRLAGVIVAPASNFARSLDVDRLVLDAEAVVEATLAREGADQRVLAALEADALRVAGARLLALGAAARGGAVTAGVAAADALPLVYRARVGREVVLRISSSATSSTVTRWRTVWTMPRLV